MSKTIRADLANHRPSGAIPSYHIANYTIRLESLPKSAPLVGQLISFGQSAYSLLFLSIFYSTLQFIGTLVIKWNAATAWTVRKKNGRVVCERQIAWNVSWWAASRLILLCLHSWLRTVRDLEIVRGRNNSQLGSNVLLMYFRVVYTCTDKEGDRNGQTVSVH